MGRASTDSAGTVHPPLAPLLVALAAGRCDIGRDRCELDGRGLGVTLRNKVEKLGASPESMIGYL